MSENFAGSGQQELRAFLDEHFCGCGSPPDAYGALLRLLRLHPLHSNRAAFDEWITDSGVEYLLLYWLDHAGLTEHGGTVGGAWLTPKGESVCAALAREEGDGFDNLTQNDGSRP